MTVGYPDPGFRMRSFGPLTSWARLLAASGMAAVVYGCETPERDARAVLRRVRDDAGDLGLDPGRVGLFAASGNAPVGLSLLMGDPGLACAALLYGVTMDGGGSTICPCVAARGLPDEDDLGARRHGSPERRATRFPGASCP